MINWHDGLCTGNCDVDADHREWIRRFNAFARAVAEQVESTEIWSLLRALDDYARIHFAREEQMLEQASTPSHLLELHRAEHAVYRKQVAVLMARHARGEANVAREMMQFLEDWLTDHITRVDRASFSGRQGSC